MSEFDKVTYHDKYGAPHVVFVYGGIEPELGVPLLNLDSLGLPEEVEARLRVELWAQGIREYSDALQPGVNGKLAAALRGALRLAVSNLVSLCQKEYDILATGGNNEQ